MQLYTPWLQSGSRRTPEGVGKAVRVEDSLGREERVTPEEGVASNVVGTGERVEVEEARALTVMALKASRMAPHPSQAHSVSEGREVTERGGVALTAALGLALGLAVPDPPQLSR